MRSLRLVVLLLCAAEVKREEKEEQESLSCSICLDSLRDESQGNMSAYAKASSYVVTLGAAFQHDERRAEFNR